MPRGPELRPAPDKPRDWIVYGRIDIAPGQPATIDVWSDGKIRVNVKNGYVYNFADAEAVEEGQSLFRGDPKMRKGKVVSPGRQMLGGMATHARGMNLAAALLQSGIGAAHVEVVPLDVYRDGDGKMRTVAWKDFSLKDAVGFNPVKSGDRVIDVSKYVKDYKIHNFRVIVTGAPNNTPDGYSAEVSGQ